MPRFAIRNDGLGNLEAFHFPEQRGLQIHGILLFFLPVAHQGVQYGVGVIYFVQVLGAVVAEAVQSSCGN